MNKLARATVVALALIAVARPLAAQSEHPFQLALFPPVQIVPEDESVRGVRLSLYGRNASVTGFDWGVVNHTTGDFLGLQIGVVGLSEGALTGVQVNFVNMVQGDFEGFQHGVFSSADRGRGLQLSGVNHARNFRGLQIAFVNYAETLNGVQIGIVNIIRRGGVLPVMPIVNWSIDRAAVN